MTVLVEPRIESSEKYASFVAQVDGEFARRKVFYNENTSDEVLAAGRNFLSYESMPLFLKDLYAQNPKDETLHELEDFCIDDGLSKTLSITILAEGQEKTFFTTGIHVLNRNGLVSKALEGNETIEEARAANLTVIKLDLKGFRNIDNVPSPDDIDLFNDDAFERAKGDPLKTTRSSETLADYTAVEAAVIAQAKIDSINHVLKATGLSGEVIWGRIGGDEFGVVFKGIQDDELIDKIFEIIISEEDGVQSIESYYVDEKSGEVYPGKVEIKPDYAVIKMGIGDPIVAEKQFEKLKENANFFTAEEVRKELSNPNNNTIKLPPNLQKIYDYHKKTFSKDNPKLLGELGKDSPNLANLLGQLDKKVPGADEKRALERSFSHFCIDYVYDRLSHTSVTNLRTFMNHVAVNAEEGKRGKYRETAFYAFDLQGPKGINDLVSYGATDLGVLSTILRVTELKEQALTNGIIIRRGLDIIIGRSGTKLLVCLASPFGVNFDPKIREVLNLGLIGMRYAELLEGEKVCRIPIAQAKMTRTVNTIKEGRLLFRILIDKANQSFKKTLITRLITMTGDVKGSDNVKLEVIRKLLQDDYEAPEPGISLSEFLDDRVFIPEYFRRVRVVERMTELIKACSSLIDAYSPVFRRDSTTLARLMAFRDEFTKRRNKQLEA